jgi:hypothetical protein
MTSTGRPGRPKELIRRQATAARIAGEHMTAAALDMPRDGVDQAAPRRSASGQAVRSRRSGDQFGPKTSPRRAGPGR